MKALMLGFTMLAGVLFTDCSSNNNGEKEATTSRSDTAKASPVTNSTEAAPTPSIEEVVSYYIQLKNALANDNGKDAANAGKQLYEALAKVKEASFTAEQKKVYEDVEDDMKEHAEHISTNADKIAHQREHFEILSKDMYDLVKAVKLSQPLYQLQCPAGNEGKGVTWISVGKEGNNPYLGKKMPDCGTAKEEIK